MSGLSESLIQFNKSGIPEMVRWKYRMMTKNPFSFFRGTCHLFYEDLAKAPPLPHSPLTWICGDLHLENFGSYRGDNKLVYFDMNDFDEAILAPANFELVRMITSIFVAFDAMNIEKEKAVNMARLFLTVYANTLMTGKTLSLEPRTAKGIVCEFLKSALRSTKSDLIRKRTAVKNKQKLLLSLEHERHFKLDKNLKSALINHAHEWVRTSSDGPYNYKVLSAVFRLAGTGSVGVRRYLLLLKSTNTKNKYLFLDLKQARRSSVEPHTSIQQLKWETEADRVISIQKRMQNVTASLLSTTIFQDEAFIIQELQPVKDTINFKRLKGYRDIYQVINDMATLTASAQLRSGGIQGSSIIDDLMAFGSSDDWQQPLLDYAQNYAEKVKYDYAQFLTDYANGIFD